MVIVLETSAFRDKTESYGTSGSPRRDLIDLERYQLDDPTHLAAVKASLDREGVVILPDFLRASARDTLIL